MTVENGMIFRVVDIEAMGIVKEWGEPMWPYLQEALDRAITVGGIEEFEPNYKKAEVVFQVVAPTATGLGLGPAARAVADAAYKPESGDCEHSVVRTDDHCESCDLYLGEGTWVTASGTGPNYDAFFEVLESWKYGDARWNGVKQDEMYRQAVRAAFPDG